MRFSVAGLIGLLSSTALAAPSGPASQARLRTGINNGAKSDSKPKELSVMTWNVWQKGTNVNDHHAKEVKFLTEADVDIIGLQETNSTHTQGLADALGYSWATAHDAGILSRYPITKSNTADIGVSVTVDLGDRHFHMWSVHASARPYGPYKPCFEGASAEDVLKVEAGRGEEVRRTLLNMDKWYEDAPVLLVGDFNAPSHLDWIDATSDLHCGAGYVEWPTSKKPFDAGLLDAYRQVHPNPATHPGDTWSPIEKQQKLGPEPQDRIDFIYHSDKLKAKEAETVMRGTPQMLGRHQDNRWTSDHKAVVARFSFLDN